MGIPAILSALTLLLLVATVVYARRQWLEANRSANSSEVAANAAQSAAETANDTLKEMKTGQGARDTHTLAGQAVTQAKQTTNLAGATTSLAQTSQAALISVQRAFVFATGFDGIRVSDPQNAARTTGFYLSSSTGSDPLEKTSLIVPALNKHDYRRHFSACIIAVAAAKSGDVGDVGQTK